MTKPLHFWQVDAFAKQPFQGNPAAVVVLDDELPEALMQNIAMEMNLAETAFVLRRAGQNPLLRWFTPVFEVDLCGHATLASAHILMTQHHPEWRMVAFDTKVAGALKVERLEQGYAMDFPARLGEKQALADLPSFMLDALTALARPHTAYKARDLMLIYDDPRVVREMAPDFQALSRYPDWVVATAPSDDSRYDFISRFFCPNDGVNEDPVTGSAHCTLAPYWAQTLGKDELRAYQASKRGGELGLRVTHDRVEIRGDAVTVLDGTLYV